MTKPLKQTLAQRNEELIATVAFLTNARDNLASAGHVLRGLIDNLKAKLAKETIDLEFLQGAYNASVSANQAGNKIIQSQKATISHLEAKVANSYATLEILQKKVDEMLAVQGQSDDYVATLTRVQHRNFISIRELTRKLDESQSEVTRMYNVSESHLDVSQMYKKLYWKWRTVSVWSLIVAVLLSVPFICGVVDHIRVYHH